MYTHTHENTRSLLQIDLKLRHSHTHTHTHTHTHSLGDGSKRTVAVNYQGFLCVCVCVRVCVSFVVSLTNNSWGGFGGVMKEVILTGTSSSSLLLSPPLSVSHSLKHTLISTSLARTHARTHTHTHTHTHLPTHTGCSGSSSAVMTLTERSSCPFRDSMCNSDSKHHMCVVSPPSLSLRWKVS